METCINRQVFIHDYIFRNALINGFFSDGIFEFYKDTRLFSLTKRKWFQGPKFPTSIGIEEGCATLLDRHTVMILGMTKLFGKL